MRDEILENKIIENLKLRMAVDKMINEYEEECLKRVKILKIVAMFICCLILSLGVSYAKEIKEIFENFFNNTNNGISVAVDNDFVQYSDSDFVYSNNIGIKLNAIVLDDLHCNLSYIFDLCGNDTESLKNIRFKNYSIKTEYGRVICASNLEYEEDIEKIFLANSVNWLESGEKLNNNQFSDSMLISLKENDKKIEKLIFEITSLSKIYEDDSVEEIGGKWSFEVVISEKMNPTIIEYVYEDKIVGVIDANANLNPTGLDLFIKLEEPINLIDYTLKTDNPKGVWGIFLIKNNGKELIATELSPANDDHTAWNLIFPDMTSFTDIDNINLYIEVLDKCITLKKK